MSNFPSLSDVLFWRAASDKFPEQSYVTQMYHSFHTYKVEFSAINAVNALLSATAIVSLCHFKAQVVQRMQ